MPLKKFVGRFPFRLPTDAEMDALDAKRAAEAREQKHAVVERLRRANPSPFPEMLSWMDAAA